MFRATVLLCATGVSAIFDLGGQPPATPAPPQFSGLVPQPTTQGPSEAAADMKEYNADKLPPMPTYEAEVTAAPSPFDDVDVEAAKQALTGLGAELNEKYDEYQNQPEVFAHHTALLKAKHIILEEKRATMILIKSTWHRRCDLLDAQWDELKKPIEQHIEDAKDAAKKEAEKKYAPAIEAAKHEKEVRSLAVNQKFAQLKQQEEANLKTALAAEDSAFAAKVQEIKRQAAAARSATGEARADEATPASHHVLAIGIVALAGFAIAQASTSGKAPEQAKEGQYGTL